MLLEMEIMELLNLLESPDALFSKVMRLRKKNHFIRLNVVLLQVREAVAVLDQHERSVNEGHH